MTEPEMAKATPEQEAELSRLADAAGEEIPGGMRAAEAAQRIEELKAQKAGQE